MMKEINLYDYIDYRVYLRAYYENKKLVDKKFSHRYFALKLGVKSSGFFSEILNGKRNLSRKNIIQFSKFLKFNAQETGYFESLVHFNQAKTHSEKNYWLTKMISNKNTECIHLNKDVYQYFSQWYNAAIRELLFFYKFKGDFKELASMLSPSIKVDQARNAIILLKKLDLIEQLPSGEFCQKDTIISTGDQVKSVEVANFQLQMFELAKNALENTPGNQRDLSTVTLSISKKGFDKMKSIVKQTRKEILKVAQNDSGEDRVVQLNMQIFPLTQFNTKG